MINNEYYIKESFFKRETEHIFNEGWIYVAHRNQLSADNDFVTISLLQKELVVQNFKGTIKCFDNICLHRFNKIQGEESGNGPLFCKYHAWAYNQNGEAGVAKPMKEELAAQGRNCLKSYPVEACGDFLFANLSAEKGQTLEQHLGDFAGVLEEFSRSMGALINKEAHTIPHQANWKLLVENVLECYHCKVVHKNTLVPMGIGYAKPENHRQFENNDMIDYPMKEGRNTQARSAKLAFLDNRVYKHASLRHIYIYPNLFITSTDGILFYVGKLTPVNVNHTTLVASFFGPKLANDEGVNRFLFDAYLKASVDSAIEVIKEDRGILEDIQRSLPKVPDQQQIFGDEEFRIVNFHNKIINTIKILENDGTVY